MKNPWGYTSKNSSVIVYGKWWLIETLPYWKGVTPCFLAKHFGHLVSTTSRYSRKYAKLSISPLHPLPPSFRKSFRCCSSLLWWMPIAQPRITSLFILFPPYVHHACWWAAHILSLFTVFLDLPPSLLLRISSHSLLPPCHWGQIFFRFWVGFGDFTSFFAAYIKFITSVTDDAFVMKNMLKPAMNNEVENCTCCGYQGELWRGRGGSPSPTSPLSWRHFKNLYYSIPPPSHPPCILSIQHLNACLSLLNLHIAIQRKGPWLLVECTIS